MMKFGRSSRLHVLERFGARAHGGHAVTVHLQQRLQILAYARLVIHHQNAFLFSHFCVPLLDA